MIEFGQLLVEEFSLSVICWVQWSVKVDDPGELTCPKQTYANRVQ